jgi:hypothetical protein
MGTVKRQRLATYSTAVPRLGQNLSLHISWNSWPTRLRTHPRCSLLMPNAAGEQRPTLDETGTSQKNAPGGPSAPVACSAIPLRRVVYGVCVVGGSGASKGASATLTQAQTPCQSRSERWPACIGWGEGGSVAKKLRKTEGTRKPACAQSCNR